MTKDPRLSIRISEELRKQFAIYCVENNTSMQAVVIEYIKDLLRDYVK